MKEILEKDYSRRPFLLSIIFLLILLSFIRYYLIPDISSSFEGGWLVFFATILDGLIASVLVTVGLAVTVFAMSPDILRKSNIRVVEPRALKTLFNTALESSEIWWYKGGCGRYFRTQTLPIMAKCARDSSQSREVRVSILNPLNEKIVEKHATFRRSTAAGYSDADSWTDARVRNELYATIVTTLLYQIEAPSLRITLHLIPCYSAFRIDLSDHYAIITKEDKKAPAIFCDKGTYFYKSYKDEIVLAENQGERVSVLNNKGYSRSKLSASEVKAILEEVGLWSEKIKSVDQEEIAKLVINQKNPYA